MRVQPLGRVKEGKNFEKRGESVQKRTNPNGDRRRVFKHHSRHVQKITRSGVGRMQAAGGERVRRLQRDRLDERPALTCSPRCFLMRLEYSDSEVGGGGVRA